VPRPSAEAPRAAAAVPHPADIAAALDLILRRASLCCSSATASRLRASGEVDRIRPQARIPVISSPNGFGTIDRTIPLSLGSSPQWRVSGQSGRASRPTS